MLKECTSFSLTPSWMMILSNNCTSILSLVFFLCFVAMGGCDAPCSIFIADFRTEVQRLSAYLQHAEAVLQATFWISSLEQIQSHFVIQKRARWGDKFSYAHHALIIGVERSASGFRTRSRRESRKIGRLESHNIYDIQLHRNPTALCFQKRNSIQGLLLFFHIVAALVRLQLINHIIAKL